MPQESMTELEEAVNELTENDLTSPGLGQAVVGGKRSGTKRYGQISVCVTMQGLKFREFFRGEGRSGKGRHFVQGGFSFHDAARRQSAFLTLAISRV